MIKFITITNRDITTTAACTSGISLFEIASKTVLPNPGHAKITSTTTTPLITKPNSKPIIVTTGSQAFHIACFIMTMYSDNPFDLAVLT